MDNLPSALQEIKPGIYVYTPTQDGLCDTNPIQAMLKARPRTELLKGVIVDMSRTTHVMSRDIAALQATNMFVRAHNAPAIVLANVPENPASALRMVGLDRVFPMFPTQEEAIASLESAKSAHK